MTTTRFFQIDAFATRPLTGGPAAVMPLADFLEDAVMQAIAAENNLAETAFIVPKERGAWNLRWFTPAVEVPLCGHATLAAAHALYAHLGFEGPEIAFETLSGRLTVRRLADGRLEMDFPADAPVPLASHPALADALGCEPVEIHAGQYLLAVFASADQVRSLSPDFGKLSALGGRRNDVICAAPGDGGYDVVSRFFAPADGIPEDPATGSAHCVIAPYFSARLGKAELDCFQAYPGRGADITTRMVGDRVKLIGRARTVIEGAFHL